MPAVPVPTLSEQLQEWKRSAFRSYQKVASRGVAAMLGGTERALCGILATRDLTPETFLQGMTQGFYLSGRGDEVVWNAPKRRGVIPIEDFRVNNQLKRMLKKAPFEIRWDCDFQGVLEGCAEIRPGVREETWINDSIKQVYRELHERGFAHSVEAWQNDKLVGGLFGVALNGFFTTDSLFYRVSNASKVACYHLMVHLKDRGFVLHDFQILSNLSRSIGCVEIPRDEYNARLIKALSARTHYGEPGGSSIGLAS